METPRMNELEAEYGDEARRAAEEFGTDLYVLVFQENRRGGDPVAHTPDGKTVFPDKYRGGEEMQVGEAWLCDVTSKGGSTFFAAPVQKLDGSFLMDLVPRQRDLIVQHALEHHLDRLGPLIEKVLAESKDELMKGRVGEVAAEKEQLEARLKDLEEQYDDAAQRLRRYELEVRTLREQLATNGNGAANVGTEPAAVAQQGPQGFMPVMGVFGDSGPVTVHRAHEEVLESAAFDAERYFGHVSPDRRRIFLKPHHNGNLPCVRGRIQIPGLNRIAPFHDEHTELSAYYDPRHGGYFVKLG